MQWGTVPAWVAAGIAAISAYLSWRSQRKSKAERGEAGRQADRAERAANAAERQASAVEAQQRREAEETEAVEADPWQLDPIPGDPDCYLINRSKTATYGVTVSGLKIHNSPVKVDVIGPGKREELSIMRIHHPDDSVEITWHRRADHSDPPQTKTETTPSRI